MPSRAPVLVLVGLGHLMKSTKAGHVTPGLIDRRIRLVEGLAAFRGDIACWLRDPGYTDGQADANFHKRLLAFGARMKKFVIIDYSVIDERDRSQSSLALAQALMQDSHISPHQRSILLSGAWHDGEDGEVDLMRYAFSGMGFKTRIDASAAHRLSHGRGRRAHWMGGTVAA